jgi:hypothetical protein
MDNGLLTIIITLFRTHNLSQRAIIFLKTDSNKKKSNYFI